MQDKYSLAYAMAKNGRDAFGTTDGAHDADIVSLGALSVGSSTPSTGLADLSGTVAALTDATLKLDELALSLGSLREGVDSLDTALSSLRAIAVRSSNMDGRTESKTVAESVSTTSEDLRHTREAMTLGSAQIIDLASALQHSGSQLKFDKTATSEKSIKALREESSESGKRFSTTLEATPVWGEALWLKAKTGLVDSVNGAAAESPALAGAVKTAGAVTPVFSEFFSGLGETIKTRVAGNVVDATLGKLPGVGKLFKEGGAEKDKSCCCATATQHPIESRRSRSPGSRGKKSHRQPRSQKKQGSQHTQNRPKKQLVAPKIASTKRSPARKNGGVFARILNSLERDAKASLPAPFLGFDADGPARRLQPRVAVANRRSKSGTAGQSPASRGPGLIEALERKLIPMPSEGRVATAPQARNFSREPLPGPLKMPANPSGAVSKLGLAGARRLGPMRYADTAFDVIQGVRTGDAKAVGTGLSTAGGAWAGASAGAALGTLVFPGIGTAVGGAIGGLLGSEAGSWLGDKLFSSNERLPAPNALSKELNSARTDNVQVTIAPSIQITGVNPADAQQVVNQVIQALQFQCIPMVTDSLGIRRNAALADPSGGD
ncbi:phage tail tape measure protein [Pseudomonas synxantha]|uniref:Phage tail tape measure protein n=1 Tax=Pseudomonas synxantha TaxID=47883 RepID=A0ABS0UFZ3_9PSED|nr:phage tail tape measure protein [Pseudomonas synxantha]MBI6564515.1 phage tail tape measure protein [Pseudomonas synxantha]MBI6583288.1 phage tail tape measure protein [Pseudomonas synxantha]MBI6645710.1 phage tail tape measure protein [Pseudomonas synxantha]